MGLFSSHCLACGTCPGNCHCGSYHGTVILFRLLIDLLLLLLRQRIWMWKEKNVIWYKTCSQTLHVSSGGGCVVWALSRILRLHALEAGYYGLF